MKFGPQHVLLALTLGFGLFQNPAEFWHNEVVRTAVGAQDPLLAIVDEMREHPGYHAIVVCTLPPGISRWLSLDLPHRVQRKFHVPVHHVVAEAGTLAAPSHPY